MARIRVLQNFGGRITNEQRILPGEYDLEDPTLHGAGLYLVEHGFAVGLGEPDPAPESEIIAATDVRPDDADPGEVAYGFVDEGIEEITYRDVEPETDWHSMSRDDLEAYAERVGILEDIEGSGAGGNILKPDLIAAIEAYQAG